MQRTPNQAFEQVKESLVQYLETAYKIAHPAVFAERGDMLRTRGMVAQQPFIEATPNFPTAHKLADLERLHPSFIPNGLAELVQHGVPVDRFPLYTHQAEALLGAFGPQPNQLVATGTGSGKTETFLLPILADILREAQSWPAVTGAAERGCYDAQAGAWLHGRRHERRPAAIRALILYPMNALVNDQISRLRRILARGESPDWQRRNLNGNVLYFGMYTGLSQPTGSWYQQWRRERFEEYLAQIEADWENLRDDLRDTGGWPRPNSPEMLCRWDMQVAPPDVLVTNYSMLEYMLVRPIEYSIFEATRAWLAEHPEARFTLVLDEAHTYTGAKGTEVAYLVRRLKQRLGLEAGSAKFRAIATSASIPNISGADEHLRSFTADLFGEPTERFSLIRLANAQDGLSPRQADQRSLQAFAAFHATFDITNPWPAIDQIAHDLHLGQVDRTLDPQVALHSLLEQNADIAWVRHRTARRATLINELADESWPSLQTHADRERATAGVLAAGSFARPSALPDTPPLLSMRIHAFFRGITGLWACMDANCPNVLPEHRSDAGRPVGKLYLEPRPWCSCGARVLELFSCRHCGLLFLGGIPDNTAQSLWPWSDDLGGERQDLKQFRIFGVEQPHEEATQSYRSTRTTLQVHPREPFTRVVYEVKAAEEDNRVVSPFPARCPRCQNYRQMGSDGREVIESLRTKGPQSFSVVIEEGFRNQSRVRGGEAPNYGRKAMLFSDSRQEAAILAANLRRNHANDLFRQLLFRVLYSCPTCEDSGEVEQKEPYIIGQSQPVTLIACPDCRGSGRIHSPVPVAFADLRRRTIALQLKRGIILKNEETPCFFSRLERGDPACYAEAELFFNILLRRELAEDEFSFEPLGLASWQVHLPEQVGAFAVLTEEETKILLRAVARILSTENALLPPPPHKPWEWPRDLVRDHERPVVILASAKRERPIVPFNLQPYRKLGRYIIAVSRALIAANRLQNRVVAEKWVDALRIPLWEALKGLNILQWAGAKIDNQVPFGIPISNFNLHPLGDTVEQCKTCAYVMSETLLNVCVRCGQRTRRVPTSSLRNYYRLAVFHALPDSSYDDPYPLRAGEHTAQIASNEARDEERWFQDLFHDHQNHHDHRVDVLSVTTTMEMGIDIGSLLCVGLRNVPPTVANYQQRAGRAGRRGSSIATVFTFAQQRSHDQYYFERPPEIVSDPPRVPALYLNNEVIARRHVRSLILQDFFYQLYRPQIGRGLFESWGTIVEFITNQTADRLQHYLVANRARLIAHCSAVVHESFVPSLGSWIEAIRAELQEIVATRDEKKGLFEELIASGLLPKYAFPVDVVSLSIPQASPTAAYGETAELDVMQRDLKIAITEYAPGSEVVRQSFPNTYKYRSVGVYDPFAKQPDYLPTGMLVECHDCQSIELLAVAAVMPDRCGECGSLNIIPLPYLRPKGFTVDAAERNGGAILYGGDGRERSGYTMSAKLMVGQTSFANGTPPAPFAARLYTLVRRGQLFICNKGTARDFPGFLICPTCGRVLDPDKLERHRYPADVPPHQGRQRGPRAGSWCPNQSLFQNQVILGHPFFSEIVLLGVDLPPTLDAPFNEASGVAVWYSFGTLVGNAAARILQIDPGELKVGARAVRRGIGRLHSEIFLYDDVPGGAGYARAIEKHLPEIMAKALELGRCCSNPVCGGACYHCMYDYRNQQLHPLLDRALGTAVLEYILCGASPKLDLRQVHACGITLTEYARANWQILPSVEEGNYRFPCVLQNNAGDRIGLWIIHPLAARPSPNEQQAVLAKYGFRVAVHTTFDVERRPFWVLNNLVRR